MSSLVDLPAALDNAAAVFAQHAELMARADGLQGQVLTAMNAVMESIIGPGSTITWPDLTLGMPLGWGASLDKPTFGELVDIPDDSARQALIGQVIDGQPVLGDAYYDGLYQSAAARSAAAYADDIAGIADSLGGMGELPSTAHVAANNARKAKYAAELQEASWAALNAKSKDRREDMWKAISEFFSGALAKAQAEAASIQASAAKFNAELSAELGRIEAEANQLKLAVSNAEVNVKIGAANAELLVKVAEFDKTIRARMAEAILGATQAMWAAMLTAGGTTTHVGVSLSESASNSGSACDCP